MRNPNNYGTLKGILQTEPHIIPNKDGSKKVFLNLQVKYKNSTQTIPLQGFIPNTFKGNGPYGYLKAKETVFVEYCIKMNEYHGQNNLILQIDSIKFGKDLPNEDNKSENTENTPASEETNDEPADLQPPQSSSPIQNVCFSEDLDF